MDADAASAVLCNFQDHVFRKMCAWFTLVESAWKIYKVRKDISLQLG